MARRQHSSSIAVARQLSEIALAAPQVIAHRGARMAFNAPHYSARDQAEFQRMVQEKQVAAVQSWQAMFAEGLKIQQEFARFWVAAFMQGFAFGRWPMAPRVSSQRLATGLQRIANKGLAPIHATAIANSKRLARTPLR